MNKADKIRYAKINIRGLKWLKDQYQYNLITNEVISKLDKMIDDLIKELEERVVK